MKFKEEVQSGDLRRELAAIRDFLIDAIEDCTSPRELAPLTRQLAEVVIQLHEIPEPANVSDADQVAARRRARRANSA